MPNYNITIDSKFDPYSFEDYLKPAMLMQEQHNQAADAYATALANSAGLYDALRANEEDALAAKYVNDYENSLNELANDLATNGLNRTNRRGVYETKAKTGYIEKLKKAMDNRNTFIAQQNELLAKDPTRRISDYAYNHGITRFINPDFTYGSFSEASIQKQVEDTVKYLAKSTYLRDPNNPEFKHIGGLTYLMKEKTGATDEEINTAMQAIMSGQPLNEKQSKIAQMLYDDAISIANQHLGNWDWDDDSKQKAYEAASRGLYSALGTEDFKPINISEPRESTSSKSPKVAPQLSNRWHTLVFGDSAKDRTGVTGATDRWAANYYNKNIAQTYLNGNNNALLNDPGKIEAVFGLNNATDNDNIIRTMEVARAMGMSSDTIEKLKQLDNRIKDKSVTEKVQVNSSTGQGLPVSTSFEKSNYQPTADDINLMRSVWNEYDKRVKMADAMTALSFEIPATKSDIERTFNKIINTQGGYTDYRVDKYDNIRKINGFTEDGMPRTDENSNRNTRLTKEKADNVKDIQFSAVPVTKKQNGRETTDLYYIMTIDGEHYLVPDNYIPKNLKPDNLKSVKEYVDIQRKYDKWAKDVDFNNLSDEQALQYAIFNEAIGYGNSALGRSAAMALIGPEWNFNNQPINASASSASNF